MKTKLFFTIATAVCLLFSGCNKPTTTEAENQKLKFSDKIVGTWKLESSTIIVGKDTSIQHFNGEVDGIKTIGKTHFSFFQHDLKKGEGEKAKFTSGAGKYVLDGNQYTEYLEYCSARKWESNKFTFQLDVKGDTLIQTGIEKIEALNVDRIITEKYVKTSNENTPIPMENDWDSEKVAWYFEKGKGTIKGVAKLKTKEGKILLGSDYTIELLPKSPYTEERLSTIYQSSMGGVVYLKDGVPKFVPDPKEYHNNKATKCNEKGEFEFTNLPKGEYYVIAFMMKDGDDIYRTPVGAGIMQYVALTNVEEQSVELNNF